MKKHVMAITYEPKIEAVRAGDCCQTIRQKHRVSVGDTILLHGWRGAPYRTTWNWRMQVTVTEVIPVMLDYYAGIGIDVGPEYGYAWYMWSGLYASHLAKLDRINPPTGYALRDVLDDLNGGLSFVSGQIIRWSVDKP